MDIVKHLKTFNPSELNRDSRCCLVIGCGAVGSSVALQLAKLGITNIVLMDFDSIEGHNVPNQFLYGPGDVGRDKVYALAEKIHELTGVNCMTRVQRLEESTAKLYIDSVQPHCIFVCVDSMKARKFIFDATFARPSVFYGETRMAASSGAAYALNPKDMLSRSLYKDTLYLDEEVPQDKTCTVVQSVGPTAQIVASYLVWMFITWHNSDFKKGPNEVIFSTDPMFLTTRQFSE